MSAARVSAGCAFALLLAGCANGFETQTLDLPSDKTLLTSAEIRAVTRDGKIEPEYINVRNRARMSRRHSASPSTHTMASRSKVKVEATIRLIYWAGGNPFHHHQDLNRLRKAWAKPETIIVNEPVWTATARHADIVFPSTTALEREDFAWGTSELYAATMHQILEPFERLSSRETTTRS